METLKPRFYKISEVSTRWNKTVDEILLIIEHCIFTALCRYKGFYFEIIREPYIQPGMYYNGIDGEIDSWVHIYGEEASLLRLYGEVTLSSVVSYWDIRDLLPEEQEEHEALNNWRVYIAMEAEFNGKQAWKKGTYKITLEDLVISDLEIARVEEEYPALLTKPDFITLGSETTIENPKDQAEMIIPAKAHVEELQEKHHQGWKPPGGWIAYIAEWVEKNAPKNLKMSRTACKRIAITVNPDRSKGPGTTKG